MVGDAQRLAALAVVRPRGTAPSLWELHADWEIRDAIVAALEAATVSGAVLVPHRLMM